MTDQKLPSPLLYYRDFGCGPMICNPERPDALPLYTHTQLNMAVAGLHAALAMAVRQNEHDMLMTGEELRACRAALAGPGPNDQAKRRPAP